MYMYVCEYMYIHIYIYAYTITIVYCPSGRTKNGGGVTVRNRTSLVGKPREPLVRARCRSGMYLVSIPHLCAAAAPTVEYDTTLHRVSVAVIESHECSDQFERM